MDLIEKAKGFLSEPTQAFETSKEEPLEEAVKYYLFIAAVYSLLSAIITGIIYSIVSPLVSKYNVMTEPLSFAETFSDFFMSFILMLICVFIWGALLHVFAYMLGRRCHIPMAITGF